MAFFDPKRPAYLADPYPALARLRSEDPVHWSADHKAWVVTRYAECAEALRDGARFTTDPARTESPRAAAILAHRAAVPLGTVPTLGSTSGEPHRQLRGIVNPVFSTTAARAYEPEIAAPVGALLDAVPAGGPFEFMDAFANQLPRQVMAIVMGYPAGRAEVFAQLLSTIEVTRSNPRPTARALSEAVSAHKGAVAFLEEHEVGDLPAGSVMYALMCDRQRSSKRSLDEVVSLAAHIATVGSDPTTGAIANSLAALVSRPDLADALRRNPERTRGAIHELLRYDSPTHIAPRFSAIDTQLGGKRIRRGDAVLAMVGAANRDPAMFPNPDELDFDRDARRQLGFGQGEHICLGAPLALVIIECALNGILGRFERIELAGPPEYGSSIELRIPQRLMLRFE